MKTNNYKKFKLFLLMLLTSFCALNDKIIVNAYEQNEELIFYDDICIEDNFDEKSIVVVLDKSISGINKEHKNTLFSNIDYKKITDLTYVTDSSTIKDISKFEQIFQIDLLHQGKENVLSTIEQLKNIDGIKYAGPNRYLNADQLPNDPLYSHDISMIKNQWANSSIDTDNVWDYTTGSKKVKIGVIDSGVNIHPDLNSNLETGYDFFNMIDDTTPGVSSNDLDGHGTHVAGIIGAVGNNNIGISGVNWNISIVPMQVANEYGSVDSFSCVRAINYARETWNTENKISILNMSIGLSNPWPEIESAIRNYQGLFVCSTGNSEHDNDNPNNFHYPSFYGSSLHSNPLTNLISVGRIDINDNRPNGCGANWGQQTISIYAPGQHILSTYPEHICQNHDDIFYDGTRMCEFDLFYRNILYYYIDKGEYTLEQILNDFYLIFNNTPRNCASSTHHSNGYHYMSGSSMSTPYVSGVAALLLSLNEDLTTEQLKAAILNSAENINITIPGGSTQIVKKLNAYNATKYVLSNYTEDTISINYDSKSFSKFVDSTSTIFNENNYFVNLEIDNPYEYDFTISAPHPVEIKLFDNTFNEISTTITQSNNGLTNTFKQYLYTGLYYLRVNYSNSNHYGVVTTTIKGEHKHNPLMWTYYSRLSHRGKCSCGSWIEKPHVINASEIINNQAKCLECKTMLDLRYDVVNGTSKKKVSINGSYVLPNGIIVLVKEDIEAYFAGTLIFYDNDEALLNK